MAIYHLLQNPALEPNQAKLMMDAYEHALKIAQVADRFGPLTEHIALKIVAIAQTGEHDPARIAERAIKALGLSSPVQPSSEAS